jgi:hypothetical protein
MIAFWEIDRYPYIMYGTVLYHGTQSSLIEDDDGQHLILTSRLKVLDEDEARPFIEELEAEAKVRAERLDALVTMCESLKLAQQ